MSPRGLSRPLILAAALVVTSACGSDEPTTGVNSNELCAGEDRADEFVSGMEKPSDQGAFRVRLIDTEVEGSLRPPDRGNNIWTFELVDANGSAVDGASIEVKPWMPDHGHGTTPLRHQAAPTGTAGRYEVGEFDLFMSGYWEFTFTVEAGATTDGAVFAFCLEG